MTGSGTYVLLYRRCDNEFTEQSFSMIEITGVFFLGRSELICVKAISKSPLLMNHCNIYHWSPTSQDTSDKRIESIGCDI